MSTASMTPGSRPRKGVIAVAAVVMGLTATGLALAVGEATSPPRVAGASELVAFRSCADMAEWGRRAQPDGAEENFLAVGADMPTAGRATSESAATGAAGAADSTAPAPTSPSASEGEGGTNVDVAGVDELDMVDQLPGGRVLVASASRLAIVDLAEAAVIASRPIPYDAQVTYDAENAVAWVVGHDETRGGVTVDRVTVGDAGLSTDGTWTSSGRLVDARRVGGELHLVATEGFEVPVPGRPVPEAGGGTGGSAGDVSLPFASGPVPCDEVLRPMGPSDPVATLIVTLPATGAVEPVRAAEVVGAGEHVHVTPEAAYLATPDYSGDEMTTGLHRFELDTLTPTGSGRVEGMLLNQFSLSEADGHLRVAVTTGSDVMGGVAVDGPAVDIAVPPSLEGEARNEVVVLDIDGDLDVVGRTARFGKPGESIHGIRFVGDVAYAVTFLTTDPFYVIDLADPSAPRVVGEVELPGFSSYLHPLADDLVVGFGPDGDGRTAAKLFDVSDPTAPRVADSLILGNDSPVAWDHHAYVDLGDGRFAVPAATWRETFPERCGPDEQAAARAELERIETAMNEVWSASDPDEAAAEELSRQHEATVAEGCAYPGSVAESSVVVVDASDGRLVEEERLTVEAVEAASRAIPAGEGWALLAGAQVVVLDGSGAVRATLGLG